MIPNDSWSIGNGHIFGPMSSFGSPNWNPSLQFLVCPQCLFHMCALSKRTLRRCWIGGIEQLGIDQYLLLPFLGGWTSIYQLFWCSPGVQGFDTLPIVYFFWRKKETSRSSDEAARRFSLGCRRAKPRTQSVWMQTGWILMSFVWIPRCSITVHGETGETL